VDRARPREALHSLDEAAKKIQGGRSVVLFPEGSRSRTPQPLPFKAGSFYLAIRAGVPIVPITLNGSRAVLKPDTYHVRSGEIQMIIHPPIATAGMTLDNVDALSERVRRQILSKYRVPEN
jgi:1-acyl-sn-glycerol-3-phosphate acyltransferase